MWHVLQQCKHLNYLVCENYLASLWLPTNPNSKIRQPGQFLLGCLFKKKCLNKLFRFDFFFLSEYLHSWMEKQEKRHEYSSGKCYLMT